MLVFFAVLTSLCTFVTSTGIENSTNIHQPEHQARVRRQVFIRLEFVDCVLPAHPQNGQWTIIGGRGSPGSTILPNTLIKFSCNPGFILEPKKEYFICNNKWDPNKMPRCEGTQCPPVRSSSSASVRCFDITGEAIDCDRAYHGSTAKLKCAKFYENPKGQETTIHCLDGKWSALAVCEPVCGKQREVNTRKLRSLNDTDLNVGPIYPWIATIFLIGSDNNYICSGSLITVSHVLSAAHCVSNFDGTPQSASKFQVAAGKTYSEYGDPRDLTAQYVEVDRIILNPSYTGQDRFYRADIAIIKTKSPFRLSTLVQPVCIKDLNKITIKDEDEGIFSLWGVDNNRKITDSVRNFKVKKSDEKCLQSLSQSFANQYFKEDNVCALFQQDDQLLCSGYSGAGWMFKNPTDKRYYIQGIVSLAEIKEGDHNFCVKPVTICTKTSTYYDFIMKSIAD